MILALVLVLPLAGCTGSSGSPRAAGSPVATQHGPAAATPTASVCTAAQVKAAIGDFFGDWNHRDPGALGRLFTAGGDLDMATKGQDTLASGAWDSAHSFGFAIYSAASDRYQDAVLLTGSPAGTPQEALDTACTVHLAGLGHEPRRTYRAAT
jgi:hypothetical protein